MFLRNKTDISATVVKGHIDDDDALAAVVVAIARRPTEAGALEPLAEPPPEVPTDPPDIRGYVLWEGASVTAAGTVLGPPRPPYARGVSLRVGAEERRIAVFGERRWEARLGGGLEPSAPLPFDRIALDWARAFGGGHDVPPGLSPINNLPHPGYRVMFPLNELGTGYYPDEAHARGALLPSIERPDQLIKRWSDAPDPAGLSPCPDLVALRARDIYADVGRRHAATRDNAAVLADVDPSFRLQHYAPPWLIFDELAPGTPIELTGLGTATIRLTAPPSPARVTVRLRGGEMEINPKLRAIHVDADHAVVRAVYDHTFRYDPRRPPPWIRVTAREAHSI